MGCRPRRGVRRQSGSPCFAFIGPICDKQGPICDICCSPLFPPSAFSGYARSILTAITGFLGPVGRSLSKRSGPSRSRWLWSIPSWVVKRGRTESSAYAYFSRHYHFSSTPSLLRQPHRSCYSSDVPGSGEWCFIVSRTLQHHSGAPSRRNWSRAPRSMSCRPWATLFRSFPRSCWERWRQCSTPATKRPPSLHWRSERS